MFRPGTVFVLGAGASREIGLPVGQQLADMIGELLYFEFDFGALKKGSHSFLDVLRCRFSDNNDLNEHLRLCRQISSGVRLAESIDNYIDRHEDDRIATCGKLAIAYLIATAERQSDLSINNRDDVPALNFSKTENTWYNGFSKVLFEGIPKSRLDYVFDDISIISFNYDRCLQHYLRHAISAIYALPLDKASEIASRLRIEYPYGTIGPLYAEDRSRVVPFGGTSYPAHIVQMSDNIRTYTEHRTEVSSFVNIQDICSSAEVIVFVGFGYHEQNINLLGPAQCRKNPKIYGTAFGYSNPDMEVIARRVHKAFLQRSVSDRSVRDFVQLVGVKCSDFFMQYRKSLSA